jgi:hypothetical protein
MRGEQEDDEIMAALQMRILAERKDGTGRLKTRHYGKEQEIDDARNALSGLELNFSDLALGQDPPDCVAMVDGDRWGIEITELINTDSFPRRLRGEERLHYEWTDAEIVTHLAALVEQKDAKPFAGGPYVSKMLVIVAAEMHTERARLDPLLETFSVKCEQFTHVCVSYGYHPNLFGYNGPSYPATLIKLKH